MQMSHQDTGARSLQKKAPPRLLSLQPTTTTHSQEMKTFLIVLLLLTNFVHLKAIQLSSSSFISNAALCRPSSIDRNAFTSNTKLTFSPINGRASSIPPCTCGGSSNYQCNKQKTGYLERRMATMKYQNGVMKAESLHVSSSIHNEHLQHSLRHQMNRIRQFIQIKILQLSKYLRILLISSTISFSMLPNRAAVASSSSISIQTQPSQPYYNPSSSRNANTVRSRQQYPRSNTPTAATVQKQRVKLRQAKRNYNRFKIREIEEVDTKDPKKFWDTKNLRRTK